MAERIAEIQEQRDVRELKARLAKLPPYAHKMIADELANVVCFGLGEVDRGWLDGEIRAFERIERRHERNIL